jgi:hypothetical protein
MPGVRQRSATMMVMQPPGLPIHNVSLKIIGLMT